MHFYSLANPPLMQKNSWEIKDFFSYPAFGGIFSPGAGYNFPR